MRRMLDAPPSMSFGAVQVFGDIHSKHAPRIAPSLATKAAASLRAQNKAGTAGDIELAEAVLVYEWR